ncbi:hypothetical protein ACQ4LE_000741 [Meloidogyne hapla]|uniref:DUF1845 domain-containing protein n=1 Tax=Meloidogyne hapla TaxID=6305 RepID=A0A1I8AZ01_MELHA
MSDHVTFKEFQGLLKDSLKRLGEIHNRFGNAKQPMLDINKSVSSFWNALVDVSKQAVNDEYKQLLIEKEAIVKGETVPKLRMSASAMIDVTEKLINFLLGISNLVFVRIGTDELKKFKKDILFVMEETAGYANPQ